MSDADWYLLAGSFSGARSMVRTSSGGASGTGVRTGCGSPCTAEQSVAVPWPPRNGSCRVTISWNATTPFRRSPVPDEGSSAPGGMVQ